MANVVLNAWCTLVCFYFTYWTVNYSTVILPILNDIGEGMEIGLLQNNWNFWVLKNHEDIDPYYDFIQHIAIPRTVNMLVLCGRFVICVRICFSSSGVTSKRQAMTVALVVFYINMSTMQ